MSSRKGFTLIELLVVVLIIGVLSAIANPRFAGTKERAVLGSMKSDLRNLVTAQEEFFSDHQTYASEVGPTETNAVAAFSPSETNVLTLSAVTASGWAAEVTNPALKGTTRRCGIYLGGGTPPNPAVVAPGTPVCY
ncbi:MAG: type IV pilin protein [Gemmatimonadales bacterium]